MGNRVGELLGNYRLIRRLGDGGFAEVYLGEHLHLGTLAAIKVLHTTLTESEVEAFRKEARVIARLDHPHIVRVLDFDVQQGVPFLVMAYASGGTLRHLHPKGSQLPFSTVLDYVSQAASALQHAHDHAVIHRDIKPENLLVGQNKEVLLSDFGIALLAQSSQLPGTQDIVGTAAYMAPEQFRGKPCKASDQYSLAVIVYEWLTGTRPFSGTFVELASQHLYATPQPLRGKAQVTPAVSRVVLTALSKEPIMRFGSVREFVDALEQASRTHSPTVFSPSPSGRGSSSSVAPTLPASPPVPLSHVLEPEIPARQVQMHLPEARPSESHSLPWSRWTATVRTICAILLVVSVILWLATFAVPQLHGWFAGAIIFSLIFWIAAYADHLRATEQLSPRGRYRSSRKR